MNAANDHILKAAECKTKIVRCLSKHGFKNWPTLTCETESILRFKRSRMKVQQRHKNAVEETPLPQSMGITTPHHRPDVNVTLRRSGSVDMTLLFDTDSSSTVVGNQKQRLQHHQDEKEKEKIQSSSIHTDSKSDNENLAATNQRLVEENQRLTKERQRLSIVLDRASEHILSAKKIRKRKKSKKSKRNGVLLSPSSPTSSRSSLVIQSPTATTPLSPKTKTRTSQTDIAGNVLLIGSKEHREMLDKAEKDVELRIEKVKIRLTESKIKNSHDLNESNQTINMLKDQLRKCKDQLSVTVDQVAEAKMTATKSLLEAEKRQEQALYAQECEFRKKIELAQQQYIQQQNQLELQELQEYQEHQEHQENDLAAQAEEFAAQVENVCDLMRIDTEIYRQQQEETEKNEKEKKEKNSIKREQECEEKYEKMKFELERKINESSALLAEKEKIIQTLSNEINDKNNDIINKENIIKQQKEQWNAWQEEEDHDTNEKNEQIVQLNNQLELLKITNANLNNELNNELSNKDNLKDEYEFSIREEKSSWMKEKMKLKKSLKEENVRCLELEERIIRSTSKMDEFKINHADMNIKITNYEKEIFHLNEIIQKNNERNEKEKREKKKDIQDTLEKDTIIKELREEKEMNEKKFLEKVNSLHCKYSELEEEKKKIFIELQNVTKNYNDLVNTNDTNIQQISDLEKEINQLKNELAEEKENNVFLNEEIQQINEFANDIDESNEKEITQLKNELSNEKVKLNQVIEKAALHDEERIHSFNIQMKKMKEELTESIHTELKESIENEYTMKLNEKEFVIAELKTELESTKSLSKASEERSNLLSSKLDAMTNDFLICERTMKRQKISLDEKTKVVDKLKNHFQQYNIAAEKEVEVTNNTVNTLTKENISLKNKINTLKNTLENEYDMKEKALCQELKIKNDNVFKQKVDELKILHSNEINKMKEDNKNKNYIYNVEIQKLNDQIKEIQNRNNEIEIQRVQTNKDIEKQNVEKQIENDMQKNIIQPLKLRK